MDRTQFKNIRLALNKSQQEFADLLGYKSLVSISKKENGDTAITRQDEIILHQYSHLAGKKEENIAITLYKSNGGIIFWAKDQQEATTIFKVINGREAQAGELIPKNCTVSFEAEPLNALKFYIGSAEDEDLEINGNFDLSEDGRGGKNLNAYAEDIPEGCVLWHEDSLYGILEGMAYDYLSKHKELGLFLQVFTPEAD
jgi:transcriptional regulator with XRE-family HTH domain